MAAIRDLGQYIKRAVVSLASKDDTNFHVSQVQYNEKVGDCEIVFPYGFCANVPRGSIVALWNMMGQEENRAGIANYPQKRFRGLKEWEVQLGNFKTRASMKFDEDGNIHVHTPYTDGKVYVNAEDNHVIVKSGEACRIEAKRIEMNAETQILVEAPDDHIILKSGKTIRFEAERIEICAEKAIKWDVFGRGYTFYPHTTVSFDDCSVGSPPEGCQPPEHIDPVPKATYDYDPAE